MQKTKNKLEIETPDAQTWQKISNAITTKKIPYVKLIKRRIIYLSAACIIVMIGLGVFRYMNVVKINPDNDVTKNASAKNNANAIDTINTVFNKNQLTVTPSLPEESLKQNIKHKSIVVASSKPAKKQKRKSMPPEVLQVEKDYDELIAGQIKYIKSLALYGENASYFQEFMNDFKTLDNQEKQLRKSIAEHGLHENSIEDLGTIYQQKLTVLKKLQNEINKTSNRNKNLTDTIPVYVSLNNLL